MSEELQYDDELGFGGRVAVSIWIVLSVLTYLFGALLPWNNAWLALGVIFAPLFAGQFLLPIVVTFYNLIWPLALPASTIYVFIYFYIRLSTIVFSWRSFTILSEGRYPLHATFP